MSQIMPIPQHWEYVNLHNIATIIRGVSYKKDLAKNYYFPDSIPILRATNIQDNQLNILNELVFIPENLVSSDQKIRLGDIIICLSSGSKHLVGKTAQLNKDWIGSFGTFCGLIRSNIFINSRFLAYYLQSPDYKEYIQKKSSGININNIKSIDIAVTQVPLAPLAEQTRIVEALETLFTQLDAGVQALKRSQANLQRYRAAVLKAACEGSLVAQDPNDEPASQLLTRILAERYERWEETERAKGKMPMPSNYKAPQAPDTSNLPELPEGWVWATMEQLCSFITKGTTPHDSEFVDEGIPYIKVYNLTFDTSLDFSIKPTFIKKEVHDTNLKRSKVYPNDILMNIVGPPLGKISVVPNTYPEWNINQAIVIYRPYYINPRYLAKILLTDTILQWASNRAKATAGQFNLTLEICRALPVPIPPLAEQARIVEEVERRLSVVQALEATLEANLARAERLRQSILKQAFSGQLVPQDPSDEPASQLLAQIQAERAPATKSAKQRTQTRMDLE